MKSLIRSFCADERGATSIEYGMIVLIIGLSLIVAVSSFPGSLNTIWGNVASNLN